MSSKHLIDFIEKGREKYNLTKKELYEKAGISRQNLENILKDKAVTEIKITTLIGLATALKIHSLTLISHYLNGLVLTNLKSHSLPLNLDSTPSKIPVLTEQELSTKQSVERLQYYVLRRRNELGLSISELADRVGVSRTTMHKITKAEDIDNLKLSTLLALADGLETSPFLLFQEVLNGVDYRHLRFNHSLPKHPKYLNDYSSFAGENTPDYTLMPVNHKFKKTWSINNVGKIVWEGRQLKCIDHEYIALAKHAQKEVNKLLPTQKSIPIPRTYPNSTVSITVEFETPPHLGIVVSRWKIVDKDGELCFPDMLGLSSVISVTLPTTDKKSLPILSISNVQDTLYSATINQHFIHEWKIKNLTNSVISNHRLCCIDDEVNYFDIKTGERLRELASMTSALTPDNRSLSIPNIKPDEEIIVKMGFLAPECPCSTNSNWVLLNEEGEIVNIREDLIQFLVKVTHLSAPVAEY